MSNRDHGISTIEALIAVFLVSVSVSVLLGGTFSAFKALNRVNLIVVESTSTLNGDAMIRKIINKVRMPYWYKFDSTIHGSSVGLNWYEGNRKNHIKLYLKDESLVVSITKDNGSDTITVFPTCEKIFFSSLNANNGDTIGIKVEYIINSKTITTLAPFGSRYLNGEQK